MTQYTRSKALKAFHNITHENKKSGFTLVETLVSLLILLAALGGIVPLLLSSQLQVIRNEIETGAISVSQRLLDELRQYQSDEFWVGGPNVIPLNGTFTSLPGGEDISTITYLGKDYNPRIIYCENNDPACNATTRKIRIQVLHNGNVFHDVETIYTRLQ